MPLEQIRRVAGRAVVVAGDDIDTDRIIPARFLRCVTFDGLGDALFQDERYTPSGAPKGHVLDDPARAGASILISGNNFGCGSSREHAPQSIQRAGFVGVIAGSFAEIFYGNSTAIGLVCARLSEADLASLSAMVDADPSLAVSIDVGSEVVEAGSESFPASFSASTREALLTGYWDPIGELLEANETTLRLAARLGHPSRSSQAGAGGVGGASGAA